jgi:hypothetical protein
MASIKPPLGPNFNNLTNLDGTTLSYFQRSDINLASDCINTVYQSLAGSAFPHSSSINEFTKRLNNCGFFVEAYDNSHLVAFGAIRIIDANDIAVLSKFYGGYGVNPYGYSAFGGGFSSLDVYGELCYIYADPAYAGQFPANRVIDLLTQAQRNWVFSGRSLMVCLPAGQSPDWVQYLTTLVNAQDITMGTKGTFNFSTNPYHNVTSTSVNLATIQRVSS